MADNNLQHLLLGIKIQVDWMNEQAEEAYSFYKRQCSKIGEPTTRNLCYFAAWAHYNSAVGLIDSYEVTETLIAYDFYTGEVIGCLMNYESCKLRDKHDPCCEVFPF